MKYVYLWYAKITPEAWKKYLADGKNVGEWLVKAKDTCGKHKMKLVALGSPYATVEQLAVGVETDASLEEFGKLASDLYKIDPAFIDYAKTYIIANASL